MCRSRDAARARPAARAAPSPAARWGGRSRGAELALARTAGANRAPSRRPRFRGSTARRAADTAVGASHDSASATATSTQPVKLSRQLGRRRRPGRAFLNCRAGSAVAGKRAMSYSAPLEMLADASGSVSFGWADDGVFYARFARSLSARLGEAFAARLRAAVLAADAIKYFGDARA